MSRAKSIIVASIIILLSAMTIGLEQSSVNATPPSTPNISGDFDGDGLLDSSARVGGTWYIDYANNGFGSWDKVLGGYQGGIPVVADYDGDNCDDLALYNPSGGEGSGTWNIDYAKNGLGKWDVAVGGYGQGTPFPGDYDGDGRADIAIKTGDQVNYDYAKNGFGTWDFVLK